MFHNLVQLIEGINYIYNSPFAHHNTKNLTLDLMLEQIFQVYLVLIPKMITKMMLLHKLYQHSMIYNVEVKQLRR